MIKYLLLLMSVFAISCNPLNKFNEIDAPLSRDQVIDITSDMHIAKMVGSDNKARDIRDSLIVIESRRVLEIHNVTLEDYKNSYEQYINNYDGSIQFYEEVKAQISKKETEYKEIVK